MTIKQAAIAAQKEQHIRCQRNGVDYWEKCRGSKSRKSKAEILDRHRKREALIDRLIGYSNL